MELTKTQAAQPSLHVLLNPRLVKIISYFLSKSNKILHEAILGRLSRVAVLKNLNLALIIF